MRRLSLIVNLPLVYIYKTLFLTILSLKTPNKHPLPSENPLGHLIFKSLPCFAVHSLFLNTFQNNFVPFFIPLYRFSSHTSVVIPICRSKRRQIWCKSSFFFCIISTRQPILKTHKRFLTPKHNLHYHHFVLYFLCVLCAHGCSYVWSLIWYEHTKKTRREILAKMRLVPAHTFVSSLLWLLYYIYLLLLSIFFVFLRL